MILNQNQGLRAARTGRTIRRYEIDQTVTGSYVVQTSSDIYYDIPAGKQVVISQWRVGCGDADEFASAYLVACDAVAGGGTPTQLDHELYAYVGDKKQGKPNVEQDCNPPIVVKYSDGHRSISMAIKATDTNTVVNYGWSGWYEDEGTLS